jgi:hypothetical protein
MYAQNCSSTSNNRHPVCSYDTYGSSSWENIPDVLHMYGMCSYLDWYEYLEFIDPTDASRKNQGACGIQSAEKHCDPASFNAFTSTWWNTLRPYAETSMQTLYNTQKFQVFVHPQCVACCCTTTPIIIIITHGAADTHTHTHTQVKPHPCDRDYQHIQGLEGCSPVFSASSLSGAPRSLCIVDMKAAQRVEMPKEVRYRTYAQTLQRSGYINMLGRPPFNYSIGSPKRKSGFLLADTLLDPEGKSTIFQPCKTVPQCFMDRLLLTRLHTPFLHSILCILTHDVFAQVHPQRR